jgi:phosphopantetheine adenylyltransferase
MNSLVKSLILPFLTEVDSLGEGKTVGLFGGGFQPPTKGHFEVVKKAIEKYNPNEFIIFVGTGGGRSDITQDQSLAIWNVYKKYLPNNIKIEASPNPVSSIYRYAKEHPFENIKWFLGSRQDNNQDFEDFYKRSKAAGTRDNLEAINIVTTNDVSGTKARQVLTDKETLFNYLPDELESKEQDEVFNILNPMSEGEEITTWINEIVPEPEIDDIDDYADNVLDPIDIDIPPHFIDRVNDKRNRPEIETDELYDFFDKLSDKKDELADLLDQGEVVATDLDTDINIPLTKDNKKSQLRDKVVAVAKTIMRKPNFQTTSTKLTFEQIQGDSIVCDDCGWTWKIKDGGDDLFMCHKCGHDNTPEGTNNFFEPIQNKQLDFNVSSEPTRVDYYKDYYKNLSPPDFKIDKDKDKIVISNISKKGLEHNTDFIEKLVSLTEYMMEHINIEPLPDVNFVEDDTKNADDFFGKTAYYNPNDKSITLYTLKRHPKDVLRSFAHEMVHHKQNLEGKLQNIEGHNINEDDYLKELEREAYEYGNGLLFRGWENSIKGND